MSGISYRRKILDLFGPNIIIVVVYFCLLVGFFLAYGVKPQLTHFKLWSIFLSTLFIIYLTTTLWHHFANSAEDRTALLPFAAKTLVKFIFDWFPAIALVTIYENLREYTCVISQDSIDATLLKLDVMLFGVEPTVWIQKFAHPLLTEYFAFTYSMYLVLPLSLAWVLYLCKRNREFQILTGSVIFCMCIGFLMYLIFPAGPPRFFIPEMFDPPQLQGYFGYYNAMQTRFDAVNPMQYRSSFPSLHVALSSLAMIYAIKFRSRIPFGKITQYFYSILVVSLWISTVYLRHHWVVDIFAGWAVAGVSVFLASWTQNKYGNVPTSEA